jgi:DNA-binding PadR family transcriptional regulator
MTKLNLLAGQPVNTTIPRRRAEDRPVGPFAQLVLCAVKKMPANDCYGSRIEEFISAKLGELVDQAQVYVTLQRLEKQDFVRGKSGTRPSRSSSTKSKPKGSVTNYTITESGEIAMGKAAIFYQRVSEAPHW